MVKGKQPRPAAKIPKCVLSGKGCGISKTTRMLAQKQPHIQRVRNSSLVERSCAENVRGSNTPPKLRKCIYTLVEEHCQCIEAVPVRSSGALRRENAGMSSEKEVGILLAEYPRIPG